MDRISSLNVHVSSEFESFSSLHPYCKILVTNYCDNMKKLQLDCNKQLILKAKNRWFFDIFFEKQQLRWDVIGYLFPNLLVIQLQNYKLCQNMFVNIVSTVLRKGIIPNLHHIQIHYLVTKRERKQAFETIRNLKQTIRIELKKCSAKWKVRFGADYVHFDG
eukprot:265629_1